MGKTENLKQFQQQVIASYVEKLDLSKEEEPMYFMMRKEDNAVLASSDVSECSFSASEDENSGSFILGESSYAVYDSVRSQ